MIGYTKFTLNHLDMEGEDMINDADWQYLSIARHILGNKNEDGTLKLEPTRARFRSTGHRAWAVKRFGQTMEFDMRDGSIPLLTTKKMFWKSAIKEILWIYVKGSNKIADLGSKIWDQWDKGDGTIGPAYGFQARHWPTLDGEVDQVAMVLDKLKNNPLDRGMVISLWNVGQLSEMTLRPCAFQTIWDVEDGKYLNCNLIQRSGDWPVGVPFNMFQYAVLTHMFAHVSGLKPGILKHDVVNAHIYENQVEPMLEQIARKPFPSPRLFISPDVKNFDDFTIDDFRLDGYQCRDYIDMGEVAE